MRPNNKYKQMKLSQLNPGETGTIVAFTDLEMSVKLMEMGCLPGELVEVERFAPLGDPIAIRVAGYQLCLRKSEASVIIIQ
ncbi:ferrous iron transport protein A [Pedobacter sp. UYP24]